MNRIVMDMIRCLITYISNVAFLSARLRYTNLWSTHRLRNFCDVSIITASWPECSTKSADGLWGKHLYSHHSACGSATLTGIYYIYNVIYNIFKLYLIHSTGIRCIRLVWHICWYMLYSSGIHFIPLIYGIRVYCIFHLYVLYSI